MRVLRNQGARAHAAIELDVGGGLSGGLLTMYGQATPVGPVHLQVDDMREPLGIDDATPRFSWQLKDPARGARQTAYRVLVATRAELLSDGKADVWDSGKVTSGQSLNVKYAGPAVKPSTRYWWRVEQWGAGRDRRIGLARLSGGRRGC